MSVRSLARDLFPSSVGVSRQWCWGPSLVSWEFSLLGLGLIAGLCMWYSEVVDSGIGFLLVWPAIGGIWARRRRAFLLTNGKFRPWGGSPNTICSEAPAAPGEGFLGAGSGRALCCHRQACCRPRVVAGRCPSMKQHQNSTNGQAATDGRGDGLPHLASHTGGHRITSLPGSGPRRSGAFATKLRPGRAACRRPEGRGTLATSSRGPLPGSPRSTLGGRRLYRSTIPLIS